MLRVGLLILLCLLASFKQSTAVEATAQGYGNPKALIATYTQLLQIAKLTHNSGNQQRFSKRLAQLKGSYSPQKTYHESGRCTQCIAFEQKCLGVNSCAAPNFSGKCPEGTCDCEHDSDCGIMR
jgi:hypothetical protein